MMKVVFLTILMGVWYSAVAQITMNEYLRSAKNDPAVLTADAQISYLNSSPYKLSPLEKLEFRTQNRELLTTQQEYALRINPANPWQMHNTNQYFKEYQVSLSLEKEKALKEALLKRYGFVVQYLYYQEQMNFLEENEKLLVKQLSIMEGQSGSRFFDADEYVRLKIQTIDKKADKEEVRFDWETLKAKILEDFPGNAKEFQLQEQPIIGVNEIERVVDVIITKSTRPLNVAYFQQAVTMDKSRYAMEKSNINVGFFQTSYDRRRVNQDRNPFVFSLGVTIPVSNPNKPDMTRRKMEQIESEVELNAVQQQSQTVRQTSYDKLKQSIVRFKELQTEIENLEKSSFPQQLTNLKEGDPTIHLQFEVSINRLKGLLAKHKRQVLTEYLNFLSATDNLQQSPLTNYLSPDLQPIGD